MLWADSSVDLSGPQSDLLLSAAAWVQMLSEKASADPSACGSEPLLGSLMETLWDLVNLEDLKADPSDSGSEPLGSLMETLWDFVKSEDLIVDLSGPQSDQL
mmetsp:Transcript_1096/g.1489  ORF Transcript_1096/g.1489 Transcript_1096/m.1489 type:complete len:102 (+) Transcript_1096:960-1265(+)